MRRSNKESQHRLIIFVGVLFFLSPWSYGSFILPIYFVFIFIVYFCFYFHSIWVRFTSWNGPTDVTITKIKSLTQLKIHTKEQIHLCNLILFFVSDIRFGYLKVQIERMLHNTGQIKKIHSNWKLMAIKLNIKLFFVFFSLSRSVFRSFYQQRLWLSQ